MRECSVNVVCFNLSCNVRFVFMMQNDVQNVVSAICSYCAGHAMDRKMRMLPKKLFNCHGIVMRWPCNCNEDAMQSPCIRQLCDMQLSGMPLPCICHAMAMLLLCNSHAFSLHLLCNCYAVAMRSPSICHAISMHLQ